MASTTIASTQTDEREQIEVLLQAERRSLEPIAGGARLGDMVNPPALRHAGASPLGSARGQI